MRALLWISDTQLAERSLLGLPIGLRAAITLVDAGATEIEVVAADGGSLPRWLEDPRLAVPIGFASVRRESELADAALAPLLVLRADALVSAALVRELPSGAAIAAPDGTRLCVHSPGGDGAGDPAAAIARASLHAFTPDADHYALHLASDAGRRAAVSALFRGLIKPSDGPVSRHLNRHVSRAVTRLVMPLGMTPNQMTVIVALTGAFAAYLASFGDVRSQLWGAALYQLHSILDGCDGEIARLTKRFGKHGALIDSLVDDLANAAFFVGLSIGVSRTLAASWPLFTGAITAAAYVGVIALQYGVVLRATGRGDKTKFWSAPEAASAFSPFQLAKALLRRDVFVFLIFLAVAAGFAKVAVAVFPAAALGALIASVQRLRQLGS